MNIFLLAFYFFFRNINASLMILLNNSLLLLTLPIFPTFVSSACIYFVLLLISAWVKISDLFLLSFLISTIDCIFLLQGVQIKVELCVNSKIINIFTFMIFKLFDNIRTYIMLRLLKDVICHLNLLNFWQF